MNVALSKYYEDLVGDLIESGRYGNSSEVVRAGLRALEKAEQQAVLEIPDLDQKLLVGVRRPAKPLNEADFDRIRTRTAMNNPAAAERFLTALSLSFRTLAQWPEVGPRYLSNRQELARLRFCPVRRFANYLVFYRVTAAPQRLHILRVLHGARDIPQVLE
jgi:putative addiction module CopG family antidote